MTHGTDVLHAVAGEFGRFTGVADIYSRSGIGLRTGWGVTPALVVVDFQKGFTCAESGVGAPMIAEIASTNRLVRACIDASVPVMYTAVGFQPGECSAWLRKMPGLEVLTEGGRYCELDDELVRAADAPFWIKRAPSAFFGTPLLAHLTSLGIDTVIVAGCVTSGCIRATTIDAASHGYRVVVPLECVADRSEEVHVANLFDIDAKYGDVMPLAQVIAHLAGEQGP